MPTADDDCPVLVCDCGKRLKAPGATPGRVGRCPACGGTLRAPGPATVPTRADEPTRRAPIEIPKPPRPKPERSPAPIPVGASAVPEGESPLPARSGFLEPGRRAELLDAARQVGRGGVFRLPRGSSPGLKDALLYPLWDAAGVSWMVFLSLPLAFSSLVVFGLIPLVVKGGNNLILMPFAFPMTIAFLFSVAYLTQVFSAVIVEGSANEVHHPRWPEIEFGALVSSLFQWACGLVVGIGLGSVPALHVWNLKPDHGPMDRVIAASLLASGLLYGLMSVASLVLHGDLLALNPFRVAVGMNRGGAAYLETFALSVFAVAGGMMAVEGVYQLDSFFLIAPATWLACAWIIYLGLVVSRSLGMTIHARREPLGWFPHRERWGASTDGIDPSLFEDKARPKRG